MNLMLSTVVNKHTDEDKSLTVFKVYHHKNKTKIEVNLRNLSHLSISDMRDTISVLRIQGEPLQSTLLMVEGCDNLGRVINRATDALAKIGVNVGKLPWDARNGAVTVSGMLKGVDLPNLIFILHNLVMRGCSPISGTQRAFTLHAVKQIAGLYTVNTFPGAEQLEDWFDVREMLILEEWEANQLQYDRLKREEEKKASTIAIIKAAQKAAGVKKAKTEGITSTGFLKRGTGAHGDINRPYKAAQLALIRA